MRDYNFTISRNDPLFSKRKTKLGRRVVLVAALFLACGSISYGLIDGFHHETVADGTANLAPIPTSAVVVADLPNIANISAEQPADEAMQLLPNDDLSTPLTTLAYLELPPTPSPMPDEPVASVPSTALTIEASPLIFSKTSWKDAPFTAVALTAEINDELSTIPFKTVDEAEITPLLPTVRKLVISKGDYLGKIFAKENLSASELAAIQKTKHASHLSNIKPGQKLELTFLPQSPESDINSLQRLSLNLDAERQLVIEVDAKGRFSSLLNETPLELAIHHQHGVVNSSLYASMTSSGIPYKLAVGLGQIFESTLDFSKDVRKGDRYAIVYETFSRNGKVIKTGNILAAEYTNRGRIHQAVRYTDDDGNTNYFTPKGDSLKQAFARYPLKFTRISSRFSRSRKHPILGIRRPHLGIDFAAPTGTPIISSGDGKVIHIGNKGGYGRAIIIQHNRRYTTLYAHMSRYTKGLKKGDKVRHGQVIGYVGSTGASTGPHLHYEFHVDGVHQDPLKVDLPNGSPIEKSQLALFTKNTQGLLAMLGSEKETLLASSKSPDLLDTSRQQ